MRVVLNPAYVWDCEQCGQENFARGIVWEGSPEDVAEMRDAHGVQPCEEGEFFSAPDEVTCAHCCQKFETQHWSEPPEDTHVE